MNRLARNNDMPTSIGKARDPAREQLRDSWPAPVPSWRPWIKPTICAALIQVNRAEVGVEFLAASGFNALVGNTSHAWGSPKISGTRAPPKARQAQR